MTKKEKTADKITRGTTVEKSAKSFAIDKQNYKYMAIGLGVIILGFLFMLGGGSKDPNVFNESMFSFTRITLAPILIIAGFVIEIYAIMRKPKTATKEKE